jgi:hypothetical protein
MNTRIRNITGNAISLPAPYRGVLPPGVGTILPGDPPTVIANLGGSRFLADVFDIGPTNETAVAANSTVAVPAFASSPTDTRPDPATLPAGSEIFNSSDNAPNFVGTDGLYHDAAGNLT